MSGDKEFTRYVSTMLIKAGVKGETLKKRRLGYEGVKAREKRIKAFDDKVAMRKAKMREYVKARRAQEQAAIATPEQRDAIWRRVRDTKVFIDIRRETGCSAYHQRSVEKVLRSLGNRAGDFDRWADAKQAAKQGEAATRTGDKSKEWRRLAANPNVRMRG